MSTLTQTLNSLIDETSLTTPRDLAEKLLSTLPESEYADALAEVLPQWVTYKLTQRRLVTTNSPVGQKPCAAEGGQEASAGGGANSKRAAAVSKARLIREDWQRRMASPVSVAGVWKRLGACTRDDLLTIAEGLRVRAAQTASKADWYEALAAAVPAGGVLGDLSADPTSAVAS